jgi:hypothetical protein
MLAVSTTARAKLLTIELDYRHVSGTIYEFTATTLTDCATPAVYSFGLNVKSASLGFDSTNLALLLPVSSVATTPANIANCLTYTACYEERVYRGLLNVRWQADDLVFYASSYSSFSFANVCWGHAYGECGMNTLDFAHGNDSPFWHTKAPNRAGHASDTVINYPFESVCAAIPTTLSQGAKEYQGDLVTYAFVRPIDVKGSFRCYLSGYSLATPLAFQPTPGFVIDSLTGEIDINAIYISNEPYLIAVKATEFRADSSVSPPVMREIGYVVRHFVIQVNPQNSCPDRYIDFQHSTAQLSCTDTLLDVSFSKNFKCHTVDTDGSFLQLVDSASGSPAGVVGASVKDCWHHLIGRTVEVRLAAPLQAGTYYLTVVNGSDGNTVQAECGTWIPAERDTLKVHVPDVALPKVVGEMDTISGNRLPHLEAKCGQQQLSVPFNVPVQCSSIATDGSDFLITKTVGGTTTTLAVKAVSLHCTDGMSDRVTLHLDQPLDPDVHLVMVQLGTDGTGLVNACGEESSSGTIAMEVTNVRVHLGPDLEYCKNELFYVILDAGKGYRYKWDDGSTQQKRTIVTKGVYKVEVFNEYGCSATDSVVVTEKDCWVGVEENEQARFAVYPNPSKGALYLQGNSNLGQVTVNLRDLSGKSVMETTTLLEANKPVLLQLEALPKGLYFVELRTSDYNGVKKVMLQ